MKHKPSKKGGILMSMSTTARQQLFEFKDRAFMERFVSLYKDLFVPYAEATIKEKRRYDKKREDHNSTDPWACYDRGYFITNVKDRKYGCILHAKMEPENLKKILSSDLFRKEKVRRNTYKYVYVG